MMNREEDLALTRKYVKQGKSMKTTGVLFIVIQLVLACIIFYWTSSWIGFLAGFALFTVGKWFVERNMEKEYLVVKYVDGKAVDEYLTHGTAIGGLVRMLGLAVALILVKAILVDYVFPTDSFAVGYLYGIGFLWVVLHSIFRDVSKIKSGNAILAATQKPDQRDILFQVNQILNDAEEKNEKRGVRIAVLMVCSVVVLLVVQAVVCWIQAPAIEKKLDMYSVYESFYEEKGGKFNHDVIPELSEEWFEQIKEQKGAIKFSRFKTKCSVDGAAVITRDGASREIAMKLSYHYNESRGWRLYEASLAHTDIAANAETNISGTWRGVGKDSTMNTSADNEITIVLNKLTATEVSGSITCVRNGETLYTKTFSGTVQEEGGYLYVTAPYDQEDKFYPQIRFAYDIAQDIICNIDISRDNVLTRVSE